MRNALAWRIVQERFNSGYSYLVHLGQMLWLNWLWE